MCSLQMCLCKFKWCHLIFYLQMVTSHLESLLMFNISKHFIEWLLFCDLFHSNSHSNNYDKLYRIKYMYSSWFERLDAKKSRCQQVWLIPRPPSKVIVFSLCIRMVFRMCRSTPPSLSVCKFPFLKRTPVSSQGS